MILIHDGLIPLIHFSIKNFLRSIPAFNSLQQGRLRPGIAGMEKKGRLKKGRRFLAISRLHRRHPSLPNGVDMIRFLPLSRLVMSIGIR